MQEPLPAALWFKHHVRLLHSVRQCIDKDPSRQRKKPLHFGVGVPSHVLVMSLLHRLYFTLLFPVYFLS